MTDNLNVYQRMNKVYKIIGSQAWVKDMENKQFKSIPIDAMRKGVREACAEAGLIHVGPKDLDYEQISTDGRTFRYVGTCKFEYVNIDNPEERIEFETMGEAMDNGDKCVGKFITNLIKNHYKAAFDIGEQGKDDVDSYSNEEYYETDARIKEKQAKTGDKFFKTYNATKTEEPSKEKAAQDPAKDRLVDKLTDIVRTVPSDADMIFSMLGKRRLTELSAAELKEIYDAVRPNGGA